MTDYKKLVEALRCCAENFGCPIECPRYSPADEGVRACVSRLEKDAAAAIEDLQAEVRFWEAAVKGQEDGIKVLQAKVKRLEPKRGEWIVDGMYTYNLRELNGKAYEPVYRCSCCNRQMESYLRLDEPKMPEDADFPEYCPHCGAKMEVQE